MPKETKSRASKADAKKKAPKDKNAPKRPLSAYMFFSQDNRATVKEENPDATFGDLGKLLGAKWKEMNDDDKKPFTKKAEDDKVRYETAKAAYESKKPAAKDEDDEEEESECSSPLLSRLQHNHININSFHRILHLNLLNLSLCSNTHSLCPLSFQIERTL